MITITDFFSSDVWQDINNRVFATFGFSGVATITNAIPASIIANVSMTSILVDILQVLTAISYVMSILVAATVLYRFISWYKNKK